MNRVPAVVAAASDCRQKKSSERLNGEVRKGRLGQQLEHLPSRDNPGVAVNGVRDPASGIDCSDEVAGFCLKSIVLTCRGIDPEPEFLPSSWIDRVSMNYVGRPAASSHRCEVVK